MGTDMRENATEAKVEWPIHSVPLWSQMGPVGANTFLSCAGLSPAWADAILVS